MTPQEQVRARCREVIQIARDRYGVDMTAVRISFDLRGRAAGKASGKRYSDPVLSNYTVKFNHDMLTREAMEHILNNTIPHEYAHIMCFIKPELGRNHDSGWERVCVTLGGSGATRHQEDVVYGKGTTYEYTTDAGHKVRLSDRHHRAVQMGQSIRFRKGKGTVKLGCAYSIVGYQGRTLAAPVVKQAVAAVPPVQPPVPVQARVYVPPVAPRLQPPAPRAVLPTPNVLPTAGESKASISRRIMLQGFRAGHGYETIIAAMIAANGYDRQLARGTFKANAAKVGIPTSFYS